MATPQDFDSARDGTANSEGESSRAPVDFPFDGDLYTDAVSLAAAFAGNWAEAARLLENPAGQPAGLLRQFIEERSRERFDAGREEALWGLASQDPVNVRLLGVLRHLAPDAEPVFAGARLGPDTLWNLTRRALRRRSEDDELAHDWAMEIIEYGVLSRFASAPGGAGLAEIERRRLRAERRWERVRRRLEADRPELGGALADDDALPIELLSIAVDEERAVQRFGRMIGAARQGLAYRPLWFERQVDAAGDDPLLLLAAVRCVPEARDEVAREPATWEEPAQNRQGPPDPPARGPAPFPRSGRDRFPRRADGGPGPRERADVVGQVTAVLWAVAGMALVTVLWWAFLAVLLVPDAQRAGLTAAVILVCLVEWVAECALARSLGRRYHPACALLPGVTRFVLAPLGVLRNRGPVRALILVVLVVLALSWVTGWLPYLIPVAVGVLHLLWTYNRWVNRDGRRALEP